MPAGVKAEDFVFYGIFYGNILLFSMPEQGWSENVYEKATTLAKDCNVAFPVMCENMRVWAMRKNNLTHVCATTARVDRVLSSHLLANVAGEFEEHFGGMSRKGRLVRTAYNGFGEVLVRRIRESVEKGDGLYRAIEESEDLLSLVKQTLMKTLVRGEDAQAVVDRAEVLAHTSIRINNDAHEVRARVSTNQKWLLAAIIALLGAVVTISVFFTIWHKLYPL